MAWITMLGRCMSMKPINIVTLAATGDQIRSDLPCWIRAIGLTVVVVLALVLAGCQSPLDEDSYRDWIEKDPAQWQAREDGTVHRSQSLRTQLASDRDVAPRGLSGISFSDQTSADDYARLALQRNPAVLAAEHRVERLGQRVPQVTSLDDPMLQVAPIGEMAETAAGQVGLMSGVSQKLPFPGKLDTRGKIAEQDVAVAMAELQQTRLRVIADTRRAYWSFYFATRSIETVEESRQLLSQFRQIAETEYKAGTRSQTDVLRASVELSNIDKELIVLKQRQATARSMLNRMLDRDIAAGLPQPKVVEADRVTEQLDGLLASAAQHNPAIAKLHERTEQFRQRRKLANLNRWPDLTVGLSYNVVDDEGLAPMANGDDQWWLGFGINIPLWKAKYDAQEREALQGIMEGVAGLTAERNRVAFEVQDAYLQVRAQEELVALFRDTIIPQAKQTVDASESGYRAGKVDFLTLVDNWRKRLNYDLMYHRALADMERAVADLERAVGRELAREQHDDARQPGEDNQDE